MVRSNVCCHKRHTLDIFIILCEKGAKTLAHATCKLRMFIQVLWLIYFNYKFIHILKIHMFFFWNGPTLPTAFTVLIGILHIWQFRRHALIPVCLVDKRGEHVWSCHHWFHMPNCCTSNPDIKFWSCYNRWLNHCVMFSQPIYEFLMRGRIFNNNMIIIIPYLYIVKEFFTFRGKLFQYSAAATEKDRWPYWVEGACETRLGRWT